MLSLLITFTKKIAAMEAKLREITERIYAEGVAKAQEEAARILDKANKEASLMLTEARRESEHLLDTARAKAEQLTENTQSELRLSARQMIAELQHTVSGIVTTKVVEKPLTEALKDLNFLQQIIETALSNWQPSDHAGPDLHLLLPDTERARLADFIAARSTDMLNRGVQVQFDERIRSGFRIGPADGSYVVSFSGDDFQQLFRSYLRPQIDMLLFS
jgi:V/A-type H+/Na+-transporting ATPase subunit E